MTKAKELVKAGQIAFIGTLILGALIVTVTSGQKVYQDWQVLQQASTEANQRRFNASLEVLKATVGGIGTLATIAGGFVLYLNFRVATSNAKIAADNFKLAEAKLEQDAEKARKDAELAESRLITDRFSKAVEMLGSDKTEVCLGAIYAMERIAKDSPRDHWTIMEVLSAYVREKRPLETQAEDSRRGNGYQQIIEEPLPIDVQAALTVIGRRKIEQDPEGARIDLSKTNLQGARLDGAKLREANLAEANLQGTILVQANLQATIFFAANLQTAYLDEADLQEAGLIGVNLQGASLYKANLQEASLNRSDLQGANLARANLQGTFMGEAILQKANLRAANLQGASLDGANLQAAVLSHADLQGTALNEANLQGAYLNGANLQKARLYKVNLQGAYLDGANFEETILQDANLQGASFSGTDLHKANLWATDLITAQNLTDDQLSKAYLCGTKLPQGSKLDPNRDCQEMGLADFAPPTPPDILSVPPSQKPTTSDQNSSGL